MNRRATGVVFCLIAALLFSVRFIIAGIISSSLGSFDTETFSHILEFSGAGLLVLCLVCAVVGVAYLIFAEVKGE